MVFPWTKYFCKMFLSERWILNYIKKNYFLFRLVVEEEPESRKPLDQHIIVGAEDFEQVDKNLKESPNILNLSVKYSTEPLTGI